MTKAKKVPEIKPVSAAMRAFPAGVIREGYLPLEKDIPEEYKVSTNKWRELFNLIFFNAEKRDYNNLELYPKEGVDADKAWAHFCACMGSYEPRHEHKEMGCAYLLGSWFEDWKWVEPPRSLKRGEHSIDGFFMPG